jgi:hypothetical protein
MDLTTKAADDGLAPIIGLKNSRTGRGDYAADILEAQTQTHEPRGDFLRFNLLDNPVRGHADPAMSWYLSHRSITDMQRDVCKSDTVGRELDRLGSLLPTPAPTLADAVRQDLECDKHL